MRPGRGFSQDLDDPLRCLSVPKGRNLGLLRFPCQDFGSFPNDLLGVVPDQHVRSMGNRDGTFGGIAKGQAGNVEYHSLLLNPSGIRKDEF